MTWRCRDCADRNTELMCGWCTWNDLSDYYVKDENVVPNSKQDKTIQTAIESQQIDRCPTCGGVMTEKECYEDDGTPYRLWECTLCGDLEDPDFWFDS